MDKDKMKFSKEKDNVYMLRSAVQQSKAGIEYAFFDAMMEEFFIDEIPMHR